MSGAAGWDPRLTEARNPRTEEIDCADPGRIVAAIQAEDRAVGVAVESQAAAIAEAVAAAADALRSGGRIIYVGAGTSGRLGVLDAAECPPTFGTEPERVRGVIAGGEPALVRSSEGAEDHAEDGRAAVDGLGITPRDFVLGIATSGTTPYVRGALERAREAGARIGFLSCTEPPREIRALRPLLITPLVGPEVIAGSTRMKAGTATKLVLNTISTGAMIRTGRIYRNLMVDLRARSAKLVDRGVRIVSLVCGLDREPARRLLLAAGGHVKTALAMHMLGETRALAERGLDAVDGFLRIAVDRFAGGGVPFYAGYPVRPGPAGTGALIDDLAEAPARLGAARDAGRDDGRDGRRGLEAVRAGDGWSDEEHAAHLVAFEREVVGPRVRAWVEADHPLLRDWEPTDPPPGAEQPFEASVETWLALRRATLDALSEAPDGVWIRAGRLGAEEPTLYQFLRGVSQHDRAHALRVEERVHPALLEPGGEVAP